MSEDNGVRSQLAEAVALVQSKLPEIRKSQTANVKTDKASYSYTYADLSQITKAILPLLGDCGLAWITKPTMVDSKFVLRYKLMHVSGEFEEGDYPLPTSGTPQAIGSAITYARRYCLCSVTGVAPEDDDDAAAAQPQTNKERRESQTAQRAARPASGRTAQRARPAGPPLPGEDDGPRKASQAQLTALHTALTNHGVKEKDEAREIVGRMVGRTISSSKELTIAEASEAIDALGQVDDFEAWVAALVVSTTPEEPADDGTLM